MHLLLDGIALHLALVYHLGSHALAGRGVGCLDDHPIAPLPQLRAVVQLKPTDPRH